MSDINKEVESWIRAQINSSKPQGDVVRIEVRHLPHGSKKGHEVAVIDVPRTINDEWHESNAAEVALGIQCDADALGGVQRYAIVVFREKETDKPQARKLLRIAAEPLEDDDSDFDSEPKNLKGALAQFMRHNEAYAKTLANMAGSTINSQARQLSKQAEQIDKLLEQRFETVSLIEELQSERQRRELEALRAQNKEKMLTDILGEVKLLGPAIVNRIAGKDILPVTNDPMALAVKRLAQSLSQDPERLAKIAGHLTPSEQTAFGAVLQALDNN